MILRVPAWEGYAWLEHGFGTRHSENWTHQPRRTWVNQTHSDIVISAAEPGFLGEGDALITAQPGLLLEIRTADCVPVLLVDPSRRVIAAVHAGWRGTAASILEKTVSAMIANFGAAPGNLFAAIGPAIERCCYEVGPEVAEKFGVVGRTHLDLISLNRQQLTTSGVPDGQIFRVGGCSRCGNETFHSYRRDGTAAGRMASAIAIRG